MTEIQNHYIVHVHVKFWSNIKYKVVFKNRFIVLCFQREDPLLSRPPTDKELARLAYYLIKETATNLATLLSLPLIYGETVRHDHRDTHVQRLLILRKWTNKASSQPTLRQLMKLLTRTHSYEIEQLKNAIFSNPNDRIFGKMTG